VVPVRVIRDAHLIPGLVKIDGYSALFRMLETYFDVVGGEPSDDRPSNLVEFPYDWRLDNRVNAEKLRQAVDRKVHVWRAYTGDDRAGAVIIAHSMGGLVARYYVEVLGGWELCRAIISLGTPYRGSLDALDFMINGYKRLLLDLAAVIRTMPSAYQLLPIYPALEVSGKYVRVAEAPFVGEIDRKLAAGGLAFHRQVERSIESNKANTKYALRRCQVIPVVGTRQPTNQSAALVGDAVVVRRELPDWMDDALADGDGTVPRASAVPIEESDAARDVLIAERHSSLQRSPIILELIRGRLEQLETRGLANVRETEEPRETRIAPGIALDVDDLYVQPEPVRIRAKLVEGGPPGGLHATVERLAPDPIHVWKRELGQIEDRVWAAEVTGLSAGEYRVTVSTLRGGPGAPPPVHDLVLVSEA